MIILNRFKDSLKDYRLLRKFKRIKTLQNFIIEQAYEQDAYVETVFFGRKRHVIDESKFTQEIDELKNLLVSIQFSPTLHDRFNVSRSALEKVIQCDDSKLSQKINSFERLCLEERLRLARDVTATFAEIFFDPGYSYSLPTMEYDPDAIGSVHFNFSLVKNDRDYPISSRIRFEDRVLGNVAEKNRFLKLVFHEACVHATMYQLEQGFYYGYLSPENVLYQDAKQRRLSRSISLAAKSNITSIYPNFLEETIAFRQSLKFIDNLGLKTNEPEDDIILKSTDRNWPYNPPKI